MNTDNPQKDHDWLVEESAPCHFDHDEIDRRLVQAGDIEAEAELHEAWQSEDKCSDRGEILLRLIETLLPSRISQCSSQNIGLKLIALAWMCGVQKGDLGSMPMAQIAKKLKVSRAILSHWVRHFEKALGFHARGQKTTGAVETYRVSSRQGWETRRQRVASEDEAALAGICD